MADKTYDVEQFAAQIGNALKFIAKPGDQNDPSGITNTGDVISQTSATHAPGVGGSNVQSGPFVAGTGMGAGGQNQDSFYVALLNKLGMPVTGANMAFMRAWNQAEGMDSSNYNPFATTQGAAGATNFNSVGVKSYTSFDQGVNATAETLQNGYYGGILDALRSGNDPMAAAQAVANSPWGTGSLVLQVLGGGQVSDALPASDQGSGVPAGMEMGPSGIPQYPVSEFQNGTF